MEIPCSNAVAIRIAKALNLVFCNVELHVSSPGRLQRVSLHVSEQNTSPVALYRVIHKGGSKVFS